MLKWLNKKNLENIVVSSFLDHSLLVFIHRRAVLHRGVVWDRIWALLMQVSQDEVSHLGVQLPDAGGHHADGEGGFMVGRHLFLTLFLRRKKIRSERKSRDCLFV